MPVPANAALDATARPPTIAPTDHSLDEACCHCIPLRCSSEVRRGGGAGSRRFGVPRNAPAPAVEQGVPLASWKSVFWDLWKSGMTTVSHGRSGVGGCRPCSIALALRCGEVVADDQLIDAVWGADVPAKSVNALQRQVSSLRRALARRVMLFSAAAPGTCWPSTKRLSTSSVSRPSPRAVTTRCETAMSHERGSCSNRHWRCGAATRWPTLPMNSSRRSTSRA